MRQNGSGLLIRSAPASLGGLVVLGALLASGTAAGYRIFVRATSRIELSMDHDGPRMIVRGRVLRDDAVPQAGVPVRLEVQGRELPTLVTDREGRFEWAQEVPLGEYEVTARWQGRDDVEGASEQRTFHFGKTDVSLDVVAPARIDRSRGSVEIEVRARSSAGATGLAVTLGASGGRPIARGTTDATGVARFAVGPRTLGPAGPTRIEARSAADAMRSAGHATTSTTLVARSELRLAELAGTVPADGELRVAGSLADEEHPIGGGAIEARLVGAAEPGDRSGGTVVVRVATDARGVFAASLPFEGVARGPARLQIEYRPDADFRSPASAGPFRVVHLPPAPLPLGVVLIPVVVTAIAVGLAMRGSRARKRPAEGARQAPARVRSGVQRPRTSAAGGRASRRPPDFEVTGRVWDPTQRRAVAGAAVAVSLGGDRVSIDCDESGRFATGALPPCDARIDVSAPGYVPETFAVTIPHHGESRDIRVDLIPIRHRVMEVYRDAALVVLPERALWGFWTPRELIRFIRSRGETRSSPLQPLTDLFEEVYYAGRAATSAQLDRAREIATSLKTNERRAGGVTPP